MILTPRQLKFVELWSSSDDGKILGEILLAYIDDVKNDVLNEKISPKEGKVLVEKLSDFLNKLQVINQPKNETVKNQFI